MQTYKVVGHLVEGNFRFSDAYDTEVVCKNDIVQADEAYYLVTSVTPKASFLNVPYTLMMAIHDAALLDLQQTQDDASGRPTGL